MNETTTKAIRKSTPKTPKARLSVGKAMEYGPVVVISQNKGLGGEKEQAPVSSSEPKAGDGEESKAAKGDCLGGVRTSKEMVLTPEMQDS